MTVYLLVAAIIIMICVALNKVSSKIGIPVLLTFILLGMVFGSDGIFKIEFDNFDFAEQICSIALIFIMFYGGFGTKWSEAKPVAVPAILLSTLGVVMTAGLTGLFCHFVLGMPLLESFLIGSVISSTDAASVFSILRSKRLNLKYRTASMLEVESGSNDPCSYMLTAIMISIMSGEGDAKKITLMVFEQFAWAIVAGILIAVAALWILRRAQFAAAGFDAIFVMAIAIFSYAFPAYLGGNGYLGTYLVGMILGNNKIKNQSSLVHFFDGITGLMQMVIFFLLGLLTFPSRLPGVFWTALAIALFLTFVARPAAVFTILSPMKCKLNQKLLVSWAGLRGAASIVFAIMAVIGQSEIESDLFHLVFCIVLFSILFQGSLIPYAAKKLNMIDEDTDVFKTFNDYTEEVPVQFIKAPVSTGHPWVGKELQEILLPPGTLIVLIQRGEEKIVPNGSTRLEEGDILILSAAALEKEIKGISLTEILVPPGHKWVGKPISEVASDPDKLIIMIQRKGEIVIPNGSTILQENDKLVFNESI